MESIYKEISRAVAASNVGKQSYYAEIRDSKGEFLGYVGVLNNIVKSRQARLTMVTPLVEHWTARAYLPEGATITVKPRRKRAAE